MIQDKAWRKREETWEKEKAARAKLMKDVISARREQLEVQLEKNKAGMDIVVGVGVGVGVGVCC
jgi:hypothetical protein